MKARASAWVLAGVCAWFGCGSGTEAGKSSLEANVGPQCSGEGCGDCHEVVIKSGERRIECDGDRDASVLGSGAEGDHDAGVEHEYDAGMSGDASPEQTKVVDSGSHDCNDCDAGIDYGEDASIPIDGGHEDDAGGGGEDAGTAHDGGGASEDGGGIDAGDDAHCEAG